MLDKKLYNSGIKVCTSTAQQQCNGLSTGHHPSKRTIFTNRVKTINDGNNPSSDWYLLALQTIRVAQTIPLLMVMPHDRDNWIREIDATQYLCSYHGMDLHLIELGGCQSARLIQDVRRHCQLSYVV